MYSILLLPIGSYDYTSYTKVHLHTDIRVSKTFELDLVLRSA